MQLRRTQPSTSTPLSNLPMQSVLAYPSALGCGGTYSAATLHQQQAMDDVDMRSPSEAHKGAHFGSAVDAVMHSSPSPTSRRKRHPLSPGCNSPSASAPASAGATPQLLHHHHMGGLEALEVAPRDRTPLRQMEARGLGQSRSARPSLIRAHSGCATATTLSSAASTCAPSAQQSPFGGSQADSLCCPSELDGRSRCSSTVTNATARAELVEQVEGMQLHCTPGATADADGHGCSLQVPQPHSDDGAMLSPDDESKARGRKRRNSRLHAQQPTPVLAANATPAEPDTIQPHEPGHNKRHHSLEAGAARHPNLSILVPDNHASVGATQAVLLNTQSQSQSQANRELAHNAAVSRAVSELGAQRQPASQPRSRRALVPAHRESRGALLSVLSCVLTQLFSNPHDELPSDPRRISLFHTERVPSIGIGRYLQRLAHYSECSDEALVLAFILVSRIYHANQAAAAAEAQGKPASGPLATFQLNGLSIHRLLLCAILCSAKFYDDSFYNNAYFAKIGGVTTRELNVLEVEFLALIQFDLHISSRIYARFMSELVNPALHPWCQCLYRQLPVRPLDDSLPSSPAVDCDLAALERGDWELDTKGSRLRAQQGGLPSPITPLVGAKEMQLGVGVDSPSSATAMQGSAPRPVSAPVLPVRTHQRARSEASVAVMACAARGPSSRTFCGSTAPILHSASSASTTASNESAQMAVQMQVQLQTATPFGERKAEGTCLAPSACVHLSSSEVKN